MFDLNKTEALATALAVPGPDRDSAWRETFFEALWNASVALSDPPVFQGPDGFVYLRLNMPPAGQPFESQSLANLAATCLERQTGAALFASAADPPQASLYAIPMGVLDSLLRYDGRGGDPQDAREAAAPADTEAFHEDPTDNHLTVKTAHQVLLGVPSTDYLSATAARALHRHMTQIWNLPEPRVALLLDPKLRPTRSLVISRKLNDFPPDVSADAQVRRLLWYLPPGRSIMLMLPDMTLDAMKPLTDYFSG